MKLTEYYNSDTSINDDIKSIQSIEKNDINQVNILVLNIILKYITSYLQIENTDILDIKERVKFISDNLLNRGFDNVSTMFGVKDNIGDTFGLDCLLDTNQTAAIFKEIAFNEGFDKTNQFKSLDLGSGTGILSLAAYIAGKRNGVNDGEIIFIDQSVSAISRSKRILDSIIPDYKVTGIKGDILDKSVYDKLALNDLKYLISETISNTTPAFSVDVDDGEIMYNNELHSQLYSELNKNGDPFPLVLSLFVSKFPDLYGGIQEKNIGMFPNIARGLYKPNDIKSTLELLTSPYKKGLELHNIGKEFKGYEDLGHPQNRWEQKNDELFRKMAKELGMLEIYEESQKFQRI